jgi:xylose isomerase
MGIANAIRHLLIDRGNISEAELARWMNAAGFKTSSQNFNNKMRRESFSRAELDKIAELLGVEYFVEHREGFRLKDGKVIDG